MLPALSPGRQPAGYHGPPPKVPRACGKLECGQGHNLAWQNNALGYDTAWHGLDPSRRAWKRADPPSRFCRKLADQNGHGEPPFSSMGFDLFFVGKARRRACTLSQFPLTILGAKTTRCLDPALHLCQSRTFCILFFCLAGCTAPDAANGSSPSRSEGGRRHRGAEEAEAWDWAAVFLWALVLASQRLFSTLRRRTAGFVCVRPSFHLPASSNRGTPYLVRHSPGPVLQQSNVKCPLPRASDGPKMVHPGGFRGPGHGSEALVQGHPSWRCCLCAVGRAGRR